MTVAGALGGLCRVTIIAPTSRVDLALPSDLPLAALLASLVELTSPGGTPGGTVGSTGGDSDGGAGRGGWCLSRPGASELNPARTLDALGILDGDILQLRARADEPPAPIFDDVVDVIATAARTSMYRWQRGYARGLGAAACVLFALVAAATLAIGGPNGASAALAGAAAAALVGVGTLLARAYEEVLAGIAVAFGAIPCAFVAGVLAVPGGPARANVLLGCALWLAVAVLCVLCLGTGVAAFSVAIVAGALSGAAALFAVLVEHPVPGIAAGTLCVSIAAVTALPRAAARLARLPLPFVPTDAHDLAAVDENPDFAALHARTRLGREYLTGALIGCVLTAAGCCLVLTLAGTPAALSLAALGLLALGLQGRRTGDLGQRAAQLGAVTLVAAVATVALATAHPGAGRMWIFGAALGAALGAAVLTVAGLRIRLAPTTRRLVDVAEAITVITLLPLAALVMQLYSTVRHL